MSDVFDLEIYSPKGCFYDGDCEHLTFMSVDGSRGVVAGHEPVICALEDGVLSYSVNGEWNRVVVGDGFVEIMPKYVRVFSDTTVRAEDIEEYRAKTASALAKERERQKRSNKQFINTNLSLKRAMGGSKH